MKSQITKILASITRFRLTRDAQIIIVLILLVPSQFLFSEPKCKTKPDVTIIGPVCMPDGIGRQTIELVQAVEDDIIIDIKPTSICYNDLPQQIVSVIKRSHSKLGDVVLYEDSIWALLSRIDHYFPSIKQPNQVRLAYSMVEFSRIPKAWAEIINSYFDAIVVPDSFLIEVYKESGVSIPIFVLPLQFDFSPFLSQEIKQKSHSPMVFANLSSAADRKNHLALIRAFAKALGNCDGAVLRINCRSDFDSAAQEIKNEIEKLGCSNIYFTLSSLPNKEYLELFQSVDCYVSLSKGEGFSIQPREAMALGIPVIATNNTGQSTICKSGLVKVVDSEILEPVDHILSFFTGSEFNDDGFNGYQFNCSTEEAAEAIKDVYLNYAKYLKNAAEAREWVLQYDLSNTELKRKYNSLINPKNLVLGSENIITPEFIMTDSRELYEKYRNVLNEKILRKNKLLQ